MARNKTSGYSCVRCREPLQLERIREVTPYPVEQKIEIIHTCECSPNGRPITVKYPYSVTSLVALFGKTMPQLPVKPFPNRVEDRELVDRFGAELLTWEYDLSQIKSGDDMIWWLENYATLRDRP